jgi:beta-glucosidase/6-phospho-beta-glucosidase/beta-galactosidase
MSQGRFMFATGIENSYPSVIGKNGKRVRVDEMEACGHYKHWKEDFSLVNESGIDYLRYGPAYYKAHTGPGRYDWTFWDEAFAELESRKIEPIADLCHFGVPDWLESFQNPDFPGYFGEYAKAFAQRYPHVRLFTPVNEIFVAALFSGQYGWWNESLHSDAAFVRALHHLCKANVLAMRAILEVTPQAVFVQSESSEYFHPEDPSCQARASFLNEKRFLALDLTYGNDLDVKMYEYLLDNGMTRADYHWFIDHHVKAKCVMGNDYYITNEHLVKADGNTVPSGEIFGYYVITMQYFRRYRLPVMHTETNLKDTDGAPAWLKKEWANMHRLKEDGVPVLGFTWYSLTDQVDWDTALREQNGRVNEVGMYDLRRKIRPVGEAYHRLIRMWRDILPTESFGLRLTF